MKVRAVRLIAVAFLSALMHFVIIRVVLLLLPPMRVLASVFMFASISVSLNKIFSFPLRALIFFVIKNMGLPSEVLPVMSIHTVISRMGGVTVGTPHCFEMEHIEVSIFFKPIKEVNGDFLLRMSKSAHIPIITIVYFVGVRRAELNFIFFRVIELLYPVMRLNAAVSHRAFVVLLPTSYIWTYLTAISSERPSSIFFGFMVKEALFWIVLV